MKKRWHVFTHQAIRNDTINRKYETPRSNPSREIHPKFLRTVGRSESCSSLHRIFVCYYTLGIPTHAFCCFANTFISCEEHFSYDIIVRSEDIGPSHCKKHRRITRMPNYCVCHCTSSYELCQGISWRNNYRINSFQRSPKDRVWVFVCVCVRAAYTDLADYMSAYALNLIILCTFNLTSQSSTGNNEKLFAPIVENEHFDKRYFRNINLNFPQASSLVKLTNETGKKEECV